jgi:hypothetical protein
MKLDWDKLEIQGGERYCPSQFAEDSATSKP